MAIQVSVDWPTCDVDGCVGIQVPGGHVCLAHASGDEQDAALRQFSQAGNVDLRGVQISGSLFEKVIAIAQATPDGGRTLPAVQFDKAAFLENASFQGISFSADASFHDTRFHHDANFADVTFQGVAEFTIATFQGDVWFSNATFLKAAEFGWGVAFQHDVVFSKATFHGKAQFGNVTIDGLARFIEADFRDEVWFIAVRLRQAQFLYAKFQKLAQFTSAVFQGGVIFSESTFAATAMFGGCTFQEVAWFNKVAFQGPAQFGPNFNGAIFRGDAWFNQTTFADAAEFGEVSFQGRAVFDATTFQGTAGFRAAVFEQTPRFGPVLARVGLDLDDALFVQPVEIEASGTGLWCSGARFPGGVTFRLRWARVWLEDTDLSAPALLTGIPSLSSSDLAAKEKELVPAWRQELAVELSEQPRVLSLRRANLAGLVLGNVDMTDCRLDGAHNLDQLRLEADVAFGLSPAWAGWEQRWVIAEECTWRAARARRGRWVRPSWPAWAGFAEPGPLPPAVIAGLYRALRKGREDAKDEPGAADFYYGEMEMRRHARGQANGREGSARGRVDRAVLTVYWLASGYGLRAWRALAWFAGITAAFALAFHRVGFRTPPQPATYWTSLLYAFRANLSLTDNSTVLTAWGELLEALLRVSGPVLLGLALLALRGRIKR